jgi:hypothetical protein
MSESTLLSIPSISLSKSLHHDHKLTVRKPLLSIERTRHLWFGGIVVLLMLCNIAMLPIYAAINFYSTLPGPMQWVLSTLTGAFFGHLVLLMIWMSFGCFRAPWRQLICTLLVFGGCSFLIFEIDPNESPKRFSTALAISLLYTSVLWFAHSGLLVLRQFTSITLEFHQLKPQASKLARTYSISSIMLLMLFLAIPCTVLKWAISIDPELTSAVVAIGIITLVTLIAGLPLALAMLRPKYAKRSTIAATLHFGSMVGLLFLARRTVGLEAVIAFLAAGLTVALNLGILRFVGLRWLPTIAASEASEPSAPSMSPSLN